MRRAMAEAEVGDDVFLEDPTLNRLQERAAALFGREAALFVPSGSMGNLTCVMAHTRPGQEVDLRDERPHLQLRDGRALCARGRSAADRQRRGWVLTWDAIAPAIRPEGVLPSSDVPHLSREHRQHGGRHGIPTRRSSKRSAIRRTSRNSRSSRRRQSLQCRDVPERAVSAMTKKFDSVQFCLSKGLGAPVGSMIVGSREFIERCRPIRKMLGGGMRQAGVLAAAGLVALEARPEAAAGRSRQCADARTGTGGIRGIALDRFEGADEYRHLQREAERSVVGRLPVADRGARCPGSSRRRRPRAHGDASRRHPRRHRKSGRDRRSSRWDHTRRKQT